jgi:GNAT superfamily N-acetyltransferase
VALADSSAVAEISVRRCGPDDVGTLAALRRRWVEESGGAAGDEGFEERFAAWYVAEAGRRIFWLAEVHGEPVGMVNLAVFARMPRPGRPPSRWGYLGNAFVLADHRDRGVGRRLIDALLDHARAEGFVRVVLSPSERSVPFYARAGFGPADMLLALRLDRDG